MSDAPQSGSALLTASDVAARLGVKKDTVYAYVSRGLLTKLGNVGNAESLYDPGEVEALAVRGRKAAPPQAVSPIFRSAISPRKLSLKTFQSPFCFLNAVMISSVGARSGSCT